jgi:general stress protein 26
MKRLTDEIIQFLHNQGFVIVSTIDKDGSLHNACKGIVDINRNGKIYLFDLYRQRTHQNLMRNSHISITAVDEHKFVGYSLKGKAKILTGTKINSHLMRAWEDRITSRLTQRLLKNIHEEKGHPHHPEALLPKPEYLIVMNVKEIVDLTPHHLR